VSPAGEKIEDEHGVFLRRIGVSVGVRV